MRDRHNHKLADEKHPKQISVVEIQLQGGKVINAWFPILLLGFSEIVNLTVG